MPGRSPAQAGFALVETVIAAAIIAIVTAMLVRLVATDAQAGFGASERRTAMAVARSALDGAVAGDRQRSGILAGFSWSLATAPYVTDRPSRFAVERVTVTVARSNDVRPIAVLSTLRFLR